MEQWSGRAGFILAAIGAAVGLGNIWRFPAVVGQNGGGAYLVPYLFAAVLFAVPLMILEISVGRSLRSDIITACRRIREEFAVVGWLIGAANLAILSYYLVITGWVLAFFLAALTNYDTTFEGLTATYIPVVFFLICAVIVGIIVAGGIQSGIERMATVLIPLTFLILIGLGIYITQLDGFGDGLAFFLTPDLSVLGNPTIWSAAFGQVFFSFSVGMGVLLTYGSYLDAETSVPKASVAIAGADLAVAMISGIVIFTLVFTFGLDTTSGTELAFNTLPVAFESMAYGSVVAVLFFGLLFVAAIAPSVSMLEVGVAGTMRATSWSRRRATMAVTGVIILAGLPSALSYSAASFHLRGRPFLDVLDASVGTYALPVAAIGIIVLFMWIQDTDVLRTQVPSKVLRILLAYVVPAVLIVVTGIQAITGFDRTPWSRLATANPLGQMGILIGLTFVLGMIGIYYWMGSSQRKLP